MTPRFLLSHVYLLGARWPGACAGSQAEIPDFVQGLSILARNSEFMKLAATLVVTSLLSSGLYDVNSQFLIEKFGFQPRDFATLSVAFGVGGFCVQVCSCQLIMSGQPVGVMRNVLWL